MVILEASHNMYSNNYDYDDKTNIFIDELNNMLKHMPPDAFNIFTGYGVGNISEALILDRIIHWNWEKYTNIGCFAVDLSSSYVRKLIHENPGRIKNALLLFILLNRWALGIGDAFNSKSGSRKYSLSVTTLYVDITQQWPHAEVNGKIFVTLDNNSSHSVEVDYTISLKAEYAIFDSELGETSCDISFQAAYQPNSNSGWKSFPLKFIPNTLFKNLSKELFFKYLTSYVDQALS